MKIKRGTVIVSEWGRGPVVAITKEWIIHLDVQSDTEFALSITSDNFRIPIEIEGPDLPPDKELDI